MCCFEFIALRMSTIGQCSASLPGAQDCIPVLSDGEGLSCHEMTLWEVQRRHL